MEDCDEWNARSCSLDELERLVCREGLPRHQFSVVRLALPMSVVPARGVRDLPQFVALCHRLPSGIIGAPVMLWTAGHAGFNSFGAMEVCLMESSDSSFQLQEGLLPVLWICLVSSLLYSNHCITMLK